MGPALNFSDQVGCRFGMGGCILAVGPIATKPSTPPMSFPPWAAACHDALTPPALGTAFGPLTFGQRGSRNKSIWREI